MGRTDILDLGRMDGSGGENSAAVKPRSAKNRGVQPAEEQETGQDDNNETRNTKCL